MKSTPYPRPDRHRRRARRALRAQIRAKSAPNQPEMAEKGHEIHPEIRFVEPGRFPIGRLLDPDLLQTWRDLPAVDHAAERF